MATKKILVSDGSGSTEELLSTNIGYEDTLNQLSASRITAYNISSSLPSGVLLANRNFISSSVITPGTISDSGSLLQFSGSTYRLNLPTAIGGDLSGSTTALNNVKVISVANVNSGTLSFNNGGTGLSNELSGVLIKGSGNTVQVLASSNTGSVIGLQTTEENGTYWFVDDSDPTTNYKKRVDVYTRSGTGMTWTKKGNPRFIEITVVGGGGGGSSGSKFPTNTVGGHGGGGGGVTQITLEASNISDGYIIIGESGSGGSGRTGTSPGVNPGFAGGTTSFSCSAGVISATGGSGGGTGNGVAGSGATFNLNAVGGFSGHNIAVQQAGGTGVYTSGGGAGGATGVAPAWNAGPGGISILAPLITAAGGLGATPTIPAGVGQDGLSITATLTEDYYLNNSSILTSANSKIIGLGGGGGGANTVKPATPAANGGKGFNGSGGGGGGLLTSSPTNAPAAILSGRGGDGGAGYIIIKSY